MSKSKRDKYDRRKSKYATKDEIRAEELEAWRRDDEIRKSRKCRLS